MKLVLRVKKDKNDDKEPYVLIAAEIVRDSKSDKLLLKPFERYEYFITPIFSSANYLSEIVNSVYGSWKGNYSSGNRFFIKVKSPDAGHSQNFGGLRKPHTESNIILVFPGGNNVDLSMKTMFVFSGGNFGLVTYKEAKETKNIKTDITGENYDPLSVYSVASLDVESIEGQVKSEFVKLTVKEYFLQNLSMTQEEIYSIRKVFEGYSIIFLGSSPKMASISGILTNFYDSRVYDTEFLKNALNVTSDLSQTQTNVTPGSPYITKKIAKVSNEYFMPWKDIFKFYYEHYLRGTELVKRKARCFVVYDMNIVEGIPLNLNINLDANNDTLAAFSMNFIILNEYLFVPLSFVEELEVAE